MDRAIKILLSLILCIILPFEEIAQNIRWDTFEISPDDAEYVSEIYDLKPYMYVLADSTGELTIEDVSSEPILSMFYKDSLDRLSRFGSETGISALWAKLTIRSHLDVSINWLINITAQDVAFYVPRDSSGFEVFISGTRLPFKERHFTGSYGNLPCFPLEIPSGSVQTVYFKVSEILFVGAFHESLFTR